MSKAIALPERTRARLEALLKQREQINSVIDATVLAVREALEVPDGYVLRSLDEGFVAPPERDAEGM